LSGQSSRRINIVAGDEKPDLVQLARRAAGDSGSVSRIPMLALIGQERCSPALHILDKILKRIFVIFRKLAIFDLPVGFIDCGAKRERLQ
jgi:hypothetical protein